VIDTTQEIFVFADNGVCSDEDSFTITINSAVADDPTDVNQCTAYTLPALSPNNNYYDGPGGTGTLLNGTTFSAVGTYTVYVYAVDGACTAENVFTVTIGNITADVMTDITVCDSYALPALSPNNGYFSQTGGVGPLGATVDQSMTVYIYAQSGTCTDESSFVVTVNDTPVLAAVSPVTACDSYNLPALAVGNYFSSPGGVGPIGVVTASQLVYVYAQTGSTPNCFSEASFQVTINPSPVVADVADVVACESFTLEALASGGYFASPGGVNPITDMTLTQTQTVYVYEQSGTGTDICSDQDSFVVTITDAPAFTISGGCDGNVYVLEAIGTFGDDVVFQWETTEADQVINSGSNTAMATVSGDGIYNLTVSVVGNPDCFNMVGFPVNSTTCKIQKGISVDGDGHNDTFDLAGFNVSKLAIFNRYGSKVYERNNYVNEWFGQSDKGDELPDGTYYYVIERNTGESTTGWIYINRAN
jgi:gliding motility-associated-like protein